MAIINEIKQRILQLDQGSFQNLCDQILSKEGYLNIVGYGSCAGTQKTTKGTPDTYFIMEDGRFVFVEYTVQLQNLSTKIIDDINKCLNVNETKISCDKISEIIYCHTSSNIKPSLYDEIDQLCKPNNISYSIWGIDRIAENLYTKNRGLAKEYLHIPFDTNQIFDVDSFINQNDASDFAAPLNNEFMFREEELKAIDNILQTHDVVILSGQSGTGKTRLAVEYAKNRSAKNAETLYCIRNNALPIFEDLQMYIDQPGDYLLLVDDANQISGLNHILYYLTLKEKGINLKIIITVRDYAFSDVRKKLLDYTKFDTVIVKRFSREKIEEIVKNNLNINNKQYLDRICEISNGNARLAIIAGKTAIKEGNLSSLADVSKLYESYYGCVIDKFALTDKKELLVTFGIVSFIDAFHIDRLEYIEPLLILSKISKDSFVEYIHTLNAYELIDIYNNKAVRISEQCLSNYILKYVFFDKKLVSLSKMIKTYFPINHSKTISSVSTLVNSFYSEEMLSFVEGEISKIWEELSDENADMFFDFVKAFYPVNETATLLLLKKKIECSDTIDFSEDVVKDNHNNRVDDDIINVLGGFYGCENYADAIELFFMYYSKRPDLYQDFFTTIKQCYSFNRYSENNSFRVELELLRQIKLNSNNWTEVPILYLFLDLAVHLLKFRFEWTESTGDRRFLFSYAILHDGEDIINLRKIVWESLLEISSFTYFEKSVRKIIENYGIDSDTESAPIIKEDSIYIFKLISKCFNNDDLGDCILVDKFVRFLEKNKLDEYVNNEIFDIFLCSEKLRIYKLLKGSRKYKHFEDELLERKINIKNYIGDSSFSKIKEIIDVCTSKNVEDNYEIQEGLYVLFEVIFESTAYFIDAIKYYLECDTPNNINPNVLIQKLFELLSPEKVLLLINYYTYTRKNEWLYFYYYHLPNDNIQKEDLDSFYAFLSNDSDKFITSSVYRDLTFIKKFNLIDGEAFFNSCRIILSKVSYSCFIPHIYFSTLFNDNVISIVDLLELFSSNMDLLEDIYLCELTYNKHFDHDGEYFKPLYLNNLKFLERFFKTISAQEKIYNMGEHHNKIVRIYESDEYINTFESVVELILNSDKSHFYDMRDLFKVLIRGKLKEKVDNLICTLINKHYDNYRYMEPLFDAISEMSNSERVKYYIVFLDCSTDIDEFKKLPLYSSFSSWSGSEVPLIEKKRKFIKELLGELHGINFIEHRDYLQKEIKRLDDYIDEVQINEILRGY